MTNFRDEFRFYRFYANMRKGLTLRTLISDWLKFKIVERDWLMNLRGTGYRFDKTNDYTRLKGINYGKCLFLITQ